MSRPRRRGRAIPRVAAWVFLMLGALSLVVWRQTRGAALAEELRALETERSAAEAERLELVAQIQRLQSRARIARVARERLGLHLPSEEEIVLLAIPATPPADKGGRR